MRPRPRPRSGSSGAAQLVPAHPGAAGNREDVHRGAADPGTHRIGPHCWHHRPIARGHLQPDRQDQRACCRPRHGTAHRPACRQETIRTCIPGSDALTAGRLEKGIRTAELDVVAGTSWLWAREQFADSTDVLFVDEAGQLSLADVLAVAHAAGTLVLLGDPQQLAQPSDVAHPPGAGVSALEHILGEHATMPVDAGLLLDRTWRMHPRLCEYTSDVFYDGRLTAVVGP